MSWANVHIAELKADMIVKFRPRGKSMTGRVNDGQLVTVSPATSDVKIVKGDVVLCIVRGRQYLHLVVDAVIGSDEEDRFQIGNMRGGINGWIERDAIYGKCIKVED